MIGRPLLLDLFSGAGGCARGYMDAGFYVVGVDIDPQPRYCGDEFHQADALTFPLDGFDVVHASPPCQGYSIASHWHGVQGDYPNLIPATRARLVASGLPYIIENVERAPLIKAIMLCGAMFGLRTYRHRHFESNLLLFQPEHPKHLFRAADATRTPKENEYWSICGHFGHKMEAAAVMGIDWMDNRHAIAQAIPPAYTRWIGGQLMMTIQAERQVGA